MDTPLRVLLVEDSEDDAILVIRELKRGGYKPMFERVETTDAMKTALEHGAWDIVIADYVMPQFSGLAALKLLHKAGLDLPFLIVSGTIGEDVAVEAMKAGAHDYIMKGNLMRLVPAINRELREAEARRTHKKAEETIRHLAYHDALTGLVNRREFEHCLKKALTSTRDRDQPHALLYLDLDQFKIINDTCGHVAGDELLRQLAVVLRARVRDSDTLARLGGDEFGVLLESCSLDHAQQVAESLRHAIKGFRFVWQNKPFGIGVSIGLVTITADNSNVNDVLSAADIACYAAKDLGRNRIHIYNKGDLDLARRHGEMQWVSRINQALEENRFLLYQQAIVSLNSHYADAQYCEFLIRLHDGNGGLIPPGAFIPAAEHYDLMPTLDRWVIRNAFSYLSRTYWKTNRSDKKPGTFFINLSGASLNDGSFLDFVCEQIREYKIPPQIICFEITETAAIANLGSAMKFVQAIKEEGCHFALDDFGSGLSSFSYLKTIPVDYLKIDGSFVSNMVDDPMDCAIVEAINQIGHVAGIRTIGEFVENDAIKQKLHTVGVDYAQGFGIEYPRPLDEQDYKADKINRQ